MNLVYKKKYASSQKFINTAAGVGALVLAIASIVIVATGWGGRFASGLITGLWIVLVPTCFWFEWYVLINHDIEGNSQRAKDSIDINRNIWAGVGVLLALLFADSEP
ncbi:MAG: hypothetical protein AAGI53_17030 [Planctomycetota bacterium]